jgi:biopolymer transport protein ExbB/TolQ
MYTAISAAIGLYFDKYKSQFIIGGIALAMIVAIGIYAFFSIQHRERLAAEVAVQKYQIEQMKLNAEIIQRDQAAIIEASKRMIEKLSKIRKESSEQQKIITKYDLDKIGSKHPKLLENHINKATKDSFSRLEELTK